MAEPGDISYELTTLAVGAVMVVLLLAVFLPLALLAEAWVWARRAVIGAVCGVLGLTLGAACVIGVWAAGIALVGLLPGCTAAQANRFCVGGIDTPSEACILVDSAATGAAGAVLGAHALNHDPYDSIRGLFGGDGGADGGEVDAGADGGRP